MGSLASILVLFGVSVVFGLSQQKMIGEAVRSIMDDTVRKLLVQ